MNIKYVGLGSLFLTTFIIDRITKLYALKLGDSIIRPVHGIKLLLVKNRGISWGILHNSNKWVYILLLMLIALVLIYFGVHAYRHYKKSASLVGYMLLFAGASSNYIDRLFCNGVIDFIEISYCGYSFPVFNIADIAIMCGACILCIEYLRS